MVRKEELEKRFKEIRSEELILSKKCNDLWAEKDEIRNKYKKITGEEIQY